MEVVEMLYIYLLIWLSSTSVSAVGQEYFIPKIDATGQTASRSGVAQFTVLEDVRNAMNVRCSSFNFVPTIVSLHRNGESLLDLQVNKESPYFSFYTKFVSGDVTGNYSCFVNLSPNITHTPYFSYVMESTMKVVGGNGTNCLSSVGNSGVFGEKVAMRCRGHGLQWESNRGSNIQRTLGRSSGFVKHETCVNKTSNETVCTDPDLIVLPYIQVSVNQIAYTPDTETTQFECTSNPPRLLYWSIVGTRGDLLGYHNLEYNNVTIVDTNVSIVQEAGWTLLRITEVIAGGNGIEKVICFTYGTQVALATAKFVTQTNFLPKTNSFLPTNYSHNNSFVRNKSYISDGQTGAQNLTYVLIIIFLLIVIILCVVIIIILYFKVLQRAKGDKNVSSKPQSQAQNDMDANPVYHCIEQEVMVKTTEKEIYNYVEY